MGGWTKMENLALVGLLFVLAACGGSGETEPSGETDIPDAAIRFADADISDVGGEFDASGYTSSHFTETVVSLTFDDGLGSQWAVKDILGARDQKATFYIISRRIGGKGYLTTDQIHALAADGHEIGGHTRTHLETLVDLPLADQQSEICGGKTDLEELGYQIKSFAYPFNHWSEQLQGVLASCDFRSARRASGISPPGCDHCVRSESRPPKDVLALRTVRSVAETDRLGDLQQYVVNAASEGPGWVIFVFHHVCDPSCEERSITPSELQKFSAWLDAMQINVQPVGEVLKPSN